MKLCSIILLISLATVSAKTSYSQNIKFTLDLEHVTVKQLFDKIEESSEFIFVYYDNIIDLNQEVTLTANNETIEQILDKVFKSSENTYKIFDRQIVIAKKEGSKTETGGSATQQPQKKEISGTVRDSKGLPLPGVSIVVKGTTNGTITNANGDFKLSVPSDAKTLMFSFIGLKSQEVAINNKLSFDILMEENTIGLDEVISMGYSTKQKRDITGSISSISAQTIEESHSDSFLQALQGNVSGVYVESNTGQPGGGISVRIRGIGGLNNSEPLYVIDGVQMSISANDSNNPMSLINPNDIESVEILKDASSAAIYGARGANGVVIITTKRGIEGKPQVSYSYSGGIQKMVNPNNFGVLNASQFAGVANAIVEADGGGAIFGGTNTIHYPANLFPTPSSLGSGTNWLKEITHKNAPTQEHQFSISGGNLNHKYYLSLNYLDENGTILRTKFDRYSIRLNTDNKITKTLKIGNSLMVSNSQSVGVPDVLRSDVGGTYMYSLTYAPTIPVYNSDGTFAGPPTSFYPPYRTPVSQIMNISNKSNATNMIGSVYGDLSILKGLSFKTNLSVMLYFGYTYGFTPSYSEGIVSSSTSSVNTSSLWSSEWRWSNVLTYTPDLGKHHINALIGEEESEDKNSGTSAAATYNDNSFQSVSSSGSVTSNVNQNISSSSMESYFGNLSYNYDNKYYIEGTIRRDGSSRFGVNDKWGLFPSFSGAWRISKEDFFPKGAINELKIRASYGTVGNDKIGDFASVANLTNVVYAFGGVNGSFTNGEAINSLANADLAWEKSTQKCLGFDAGMFNNKLSFTAEYFETKVSNMLLGIPVPAVTGVDNSGDVPALATVESNAGSLTNKGFEFEASYKGKVNKLFYKVGANITTFNNKVTNIGDNPEIWGQTLEGQNVSRTVVGKSLGDFYGYVVQGIFQTQAEVNAVNALASKSGNSYYQSPQTAPGDFKYKDLNGDGVIDANDRTDLGSPIPKFIYGLNFDLTYKNFRLTMLWNGTNGNKIFNGNNLLLEASGLTNSNKSKAELKAWSGPNTSNSIPRHTASDPNQNSRISSAFVEDGSYLALNNLQLNYDLPKLIFSRATVFISGQNLLILTKYKGMDPMVGNVNGSNLAAGIDNDLYPHAKVMRLGIMLNF